MRNIVVLGGGTAGWLTALYAHTVFPNDKITVVQSKEIGIIGVGEATTPNIVAFLSQIGIDIIDLIRCTKGTIKSGINFENWNGDEKRYMHGFCDKVTDFSVHPTFGVDGQDFFLKKCIAEGLSLEDYNYQIHLAYDNKIDLHRTEWAIHFDTNEFSKYLSKKGAERGIEIVEGVYTHATQDDRGHIKTLYLEDGRSVPVDFVFDCSGFARLLIGKVYQDKWISYSKHLPMKKAIPFWIDEPEVKPYTSAIAMKYGWMWQIPLQHRTGAGYVFNSDYITVEEAKAEVEEYLGHEIEIRRVIDIDPGRFENYWIKNCVAVGLSSSFIEPLESTSIFLSIGQLDTFRQFINEIDDPNESSIKVFNDIVGNNMDDTMNFVYLHYLTKRNDTAFWREFREKNPSPERMKDLIPFIKDANLRPYNIPNLRINVYFALYSYLQVCYGLEIFEKPINIKGFENVRPSPQEYKEIIDALTATQALDHKEFLKRINEYQPI
jgi:tryptophan halogenase